MVDVAARQPMMEVLENSIESKHSSFVFFGGISWNVVTLLLFFGDEVLGLLVGFSESSLEGVEGLGSSSLGLSLGLGFLGLESGSSGGVSLGFLVSKELSLLGSEWIESVSDGGVVEWVLSSFVVGSHVSSDVSEFGLDLVRVDDSRKIGTSHDISVEVVSVFLKRSVSCGSKNSVQGSESSLSENHESSEVTSWGQLEDVESVYVTGVNTWQVSGGELELVVGFIVDNEWTLFQDVFGISVFSFSGSGMSGSSDLSEIILGSEGLKSSKELLGVSVSKVVDDEWELWYILNLVTSSHHKRGNGGCCKCGSDGMSSLSDIDFSMPSSPNLERSEHSSFSAHVTESGLS